MVYSLIFPGRPKGDGGRASIRFYAQIGRILRGATAKKPAD
jgi:hypothetical protein